MDKNQKDKNRIALDVLSGVDEEILDNATKRRFTLLTQLARRRRTKRIVFSSASVAACLALIFCAVFLIPLFTKQIPVYTGMTVSNTAPVAQGSAALPNEAKGEVTLLSLPDYNPFAMSYSLEAEPPTEGESEQTSEPVVNELVEGELAEKIRETLSITGAAETIYYARPNQDIYVTVHVDNPDQFEIQSFTLNGNKYSSYMFEDGSDMENLILKLNVGDVEGIVEYTIDAIKYIDGTEIKDVRLDGERTVKIGVATPKQPTVEIANETVGISELAFEATVTDELSLIAESAGTVKLVLLDAETVLAQEDLTVGETKSVSFEGLSPDHAYTYGVYAYYDSLDGEGSKLCMLYEKEIRTERAVWFRDVKVTQTSVTFGIEWSEASTTKTLKSLSLYRDESKIREVSVDTASMDGLLSGRNYRLVATYLYGEKVETAEFAFTSVAKTVPTYEISVGRVSQTSVGFDITKTDPDNLGNITKVELLHGTVATRDEGADIRFFDGLLSNNKYTVRVTYTYDVNDGAGVHTKTVEKTIRTQAKTAPTYDIVDLTANQTKVDFDITETDVDQIGTITKIELLHATQSTRVGDANTRSFDGLLSNNEYTVRVTYTYDLNDGAGVHTKTVKKTIRTQAKEAPVYEITNMTSTQSRIDFAVNETDRDNIGSIVKVELLHATQEAKTAVSTEDRFFDGLLSNNEYTIRITYQYDLNDGTGIHTEIVTKAFATMAREITVASAAVLGNTS